MHNLLMRLTAALPCKVIPINGEPYLERYYVGTDPDGTQHWLHRFLRSDSERHLHSHPWTARCEILTGEYREERKDDLGFVDEHKFEAGDVRVLSPDTLHRIVQVDPNTWTYIRVEPGRLAEWYFIDDEGVKTPMKTSEPDWWKSYHCRGYETPIDLSSHKQETALSVQVGGDHYKSCKIQPVEFIEANGLGFLEGCVVKRLARHNKPTGKGLQDIDKSIHELKLLRELRYEKAVEF